MHDLLESVRNSTRHRPKLVLRTLIWPRSTQAVGTPADTAARVQQALETVYGRALADLEHGWWTMLDAWMLRHAKDFGQPASLMDMTPAAWPATELAAGYTGRISM